MSTYLLWILGYSAVLILLGAWISRQVGRSDDFLVAGRRLGPGLIFATVLAANIGAGTTVGAASLGYRLGWSAWWWVGSAAIGCLILGNTVAPRIWRLARDRGYHTLGDFLEQRYSRAVRGCIAVVLTVGALGLLAAQLIALSIVFHIVLGVPRWVGSALGGGVMIAYYTAGGLLASAWVNLLQLLVLLAGFTLALPFAVSTAGGWHEVVRAVGVREDHAAGGGYLSLLGIGFGGVLYYLALLAPSFVVSPGLIQKVYGSRSAQAAWLGVNANAVALFLFAAVPPAFGILAAARFPDLPDPQLALFKVITDMVPTWLGILGLAAVFSAEVSTCDAVLFMLSTSITVDLYKSFLNPKAGDKLLLRVGRLSALGAGLLGISLAIQVPSIISSLTFFYSLVSVAIFVPCVVGLYSKRPNGRSALAAILVSVPVTLLLRYFMGDRILGFLNPFAIGIAVSFAVLWGLTIADERCLFRHTNESSISPKTG